MKKIIVIIGMLLCLCMCACSNVDDPSVSSDDQGTPERIYPFYYDSLSDFQESMSNGDMLYDALSNEGVKVNVIDKFEIFVEKYQSQKIIVPCINGNKIELRNKDGYSNIAVFPSEVYGLPWVFFYPSVPTEENFYIKIAYLPDNVIKAQDNPTASEAIKMISPNSPNIDNLGAQHEKIYNQVIELEDREVVALVIEYKTDNRNSTFFVYDDLLVEIRSNPKVWTAEWFSSLSFCSFK